MEKVTPLSNKLFSDSSFPSLKNVPFIRDMSVENLRYLTTEQALADLAYFITEFKEDIDDDLKMAKVVTFGGSYPGTLSAWMRLKYPHIIHAAVSSSAPLLAEINFEGKKGKPILIS